MEIILSIFISLYFMYVHIYGYIGFDIIWYISTQTVKIHDQKHFTNKISHQNFTLAKTRVISWCSICPGGLEFSEKIFWSWCTDRSSQCLCQCSGQKCAYFTHQRIGTYLNSLSGLSSLAILSILSLTNDLTEELVSPSGVIFNPDFTS